MRKLENACKWNINIFFLSLGLLSLSSKNIYDIIFLGKNTQYAKIHSSYRDIGMNLHKTSIFLERTCIIISIIYYHCRGGGNGKPRQVVSYAVILFSLSIHHLFFQRKKRGVIVKSCVKIRNFFSLKLVTVVVLVFLAAVVVKFGWRMLVM